MKKTTKKLKKSGKIPAEKPEFSIFNCVKVPNSAI